MLLKRLLLALMSLVIGVAGCEVAARIFWQAPWYERLLDEQQKSEVHTYRRNRFNLRDEEYGHAKAPGQQRILMLGDSFTFGLGVPDDAEIFPEILERSLNANRPPSAPAGTEIMNAGLPGSLTDAWLETFDVVADEFDPDLVLIVFFLRDGTRTASVPEFFDRIRDDIAKKNRRSRLYQVSYLYRLYREATDRNNVASLYTERFQASYLGADHQTSEWRNAQANLLALRERARSRSMSFGFVIFPVLVELNEPYPFQQIVDLITRFAIDHDFPVYDLLPDFMGRFAPNLWVSSLDQHPNPRAHALVAEQLEPFVRDLLSTSDASADR